MDQPRNPANIIEDILPDKGSILYIHGFMEDLESDNVQIIKRGTDFIFPNKHTQWSGIRGDDER